MVEQDEITRLLTDRVLKSTELDNLIAERVRMEVDSRDSIPQYFTREQMASMWQITKKTVDRMTDEELHELGFTRKKIGYSVRFERLKVVEASRELYR